MQIFREGCIIINQFLFCPAIVGKRTRRERVSEMDVRVGDVLRMKKAHPCGSVEFTVLRVGMDFKIRCNGCGREVMIPRLKCEKNIKRILRPEGED